MHRMMEIHSEKIGLGRMLKNGYRHFRTITKHRHGVIRHCFKAGIGFQGLFHDLSKYTPIEFRSGILYYQGTRSPNEFERELYGYSTAWLHHKGRNRHHFEYWRDMDPKTKYYIPVPMPLRFTAEMFCDRVSASKTYKGPDYRDDAALQYFLGGKAKVMMHTETAAILERWLTILAQQGEDAAFREIRKDLKQDREKRSVKRKFEE